jgi:hypothetical protein
VQLFDFGANLHAHFIKAQTLSFHGFIGRILLDLSIHDLHDLQEAFCGYDDFFQIDVQLMGNWLPYIQLSREFLQSFDHPEKLVFPDVIYFHRYPQKKTEDTPNAFGKNFIRGEIRFQSSLGVIFRGDKVSGQ